MLDEYKKLYENCASSIKDWKSLDCNTLCNRYIECLNDNDVIKCDCYLSAIILKYWNVITRCYHLQQYKLASEEDIYNWIIDGIIDALNHHVWTDESNILYNDKCGPDKAIKVSIHSARVNFFTALDSQKRRITKFSSSLEELQENASDDYYLPYEDKPPYIEMYMYNRIRKAFNEKSYFLAFLLDSIVNADVFSKEGDKHTYQLSYRKLIGHLRHLDKNYCKIFSNTYDVDYDEVCKCSEFISELAVDRMKRNIQNLLFVLSNDKELIQYIKG